MHEDACCDLCLVKDDPPANAEDGTKFCCCIGSLSYYMNKNKKGSTNAAS